MGTLHLLLNIFVNIKLFEKKSIKFFFKSYSCKTYGPVGKWGKEGVDNQQVNKIM